MGMNTGFYWLGVGPAVCSSEHDIEISGFVDLGNFLSS
jgi:hypothetical protein